jgi:hypothetical protein
VSASFFCGPEQSRFAYDVLHANVRILPRRLRLRPRLIQAPGCSKSKISDGRLGIRYAEELILLLSRDMVSLIGSVQDGDLGSSGTYRKQGKRVYQHLMEVHVV